MAHCGGICGIEIDCPNGCGVLCTTDCTDCTQWCEPTTVEAFGRESPAVLVRVTRNNGDIGVQVRVGDEAEAPPPGAQKYTESTEFRLCFNDIPRATLARLLSHMHVRSVRAAEKDRERLSGSATGTVAELAAKFALVLD